MKPCIRCGEMKPLDQYYRHPRMADGHLNKCKECCKEYARHSHQMKAGDREWVEKERARGREKHKRLNYTERYRDRRDETSACRTWRKRYPVKAAANRAVNNAVRDGRLVKPDRCQECGAPPPIHGHHEDYSKPLDVDWLCVDCHMKRHRKAA